MQSADETPPAAHGVAGNWGSKSMRAAVIGFVVAALAAVNTALCQQADTALKTAVPDAPSVSLLKASHLASVYFASAHRTQSPGIFQSFSSAFDLQSALTQDGVHFLNDAAVVAYREPASSNDILRKYLYSAFHASAASDHAPVESGMMRRATQAVSQTYLARTPEGKARLNTPYVLGVLGKAVLGTAYRPYWNRPVSAPFSDFGSRIGNDAGMNLLHEFGPGLQEILKSHAPKFVSHIAAGIERR